MPISLALWGMSSEGTRHRKVWIDKFADDSKIGRIIRSESAVNDLQEDLDRLNGWVVG